MKNLLFILFLLPSFSQAQTKLLAVAGTTPNLYLVHTTGPKESFYSVGRIYNISPKIMAPYNQLILEKGLAIGQVIKGPLNEINFSQDGIAATDEVLIPIYYKVKLKETLYSISTINNKVPVATIKKWNKLNSDAVSNGSNMIIGYLKVKKDLSPLANSAVKVEPVSSSATIIAENKPPVIIEKPITRKEEPLKKEEPKNKAIEKTEPIVKNNSTVKPQIEPGTTKGNGGIFKNSFDKQATTNLKDEKGQAGTFKSTSGWEDGKYYCLHNSAQPGTIIRITNSVNQRIVYAKVLDVIPDIKQNEGMIIRLSNAAADELGVITDMFECTLSYSY